MKIKHLLKISDLSDGQLAEFPLLVEEYQNRLDKQYALRALDTTIVPPKIMSTIAMFFLEPSTRTRASFERAAQIIGRPTLFFERRTSSIEKRESLADTVCNLRSLGIRTFVFRVPQEETLEPLREIPGVSVINAGDGTRGHPTQALLDYCTLYMHFKRFHKRKLEDMKGLKLGIMGDLRHSRVARSWCRLAERTGVELSFFSPEEWRPKEWGQKTPWSEFDREKLKNLDALMLLRIQRERFDDVSESFIDDYVKRFQISAADLPETIRILHPGPVIWGAEMNADLRNDPRSLILEQVKIGLAVRAVVLDSCENA